MIGVCWELAGRFIAFEVAQAIVAGAIFAVLLWYAKRRSDRRGDLA